MKRYLSLLLLVFLFCAVFVSCQSSDAGQIQEDDPVTDASQTEAPLTGILLASLDSYRVIRAELADAQTVAAAAKLCADLIKATNTQIGIADDFYREGVESASIKHEEILVGSTNRPETAMFLADLKSLDYGYAVIDGKLVIAGHTPDLTAAAVALFKEEVIDQLSNDSKFLVLDSTSRIIRSEYAIDSLTLCGKSISAFTVVYDKSDDYNAALAQTLTAYLSRKSGYMIPTESSKSLDKLGDDRALIYIGSSQKAEIPAALKVTLTDDQYILAADTTDRIFVLAAGNAAKNTGAAVEALLTKIGATESKDVSVSLSGAEPIACEETELLSAMSFNVWVSNATDERMQSALKMIKNYMPDTLGVQEASVKWMNFLKANLSDDYACVGVGRDEGGEGEHSAIFYAKDKFTLIDSGTKWMSATPDVPSKFEESSLNRIFTYAILERKSDGVRFLCINTHLEHTSEEARILQAEVLLAFTEQYADLPMICTGDFNTALGGELYKEIIATRFADSSSLARQTQKVATFHDYGDSSRIIDFCFVSEDDVLVDSYKVCSEKVDGNYVSDHHPVLIKYRLIG